jgi:hypothetical protein
LNLIVLSQEQKESKKVKFVFDKLPALDKQSMLDFITTLGEPDNVLIALQRIRDYYNPDLRENECHKQEYSKFVLALLLVLVDEETGLKGKDMRGPVLWHLKELSTHKVSADIFIGYAKQQLGNIAQLL